MIVESALTAASMTVAQLIVSILIAPLIVEPLPATVALDLPFFAVLYPTIARERIILRVGTIHEIDRIVPPLVLLEFLVILYKHLLGLRIGFPGYDFGLLLAESHRMEEIGHAADTIVDAKSLFDVANDLLSALVSPR